jgi:hypothetical protein
VDVFEEASFKITTPWNQSYLEGSLSPFKGEGGV